MKIHFSRITKILIIGCIIGLSLLLYPTVSNYWNEKHSTRAINSYIKSLDNLTDEEYRKELNRAVEFNKKAAQRSNRFFLSDEEKEEYQKCLDISGLGVMGYIEIPKLDISLPVYHGTAESVLQVGIGHIEWSSLPVGGENTHCVVSGHRGLPTARLFTDIDKLREGDLFTLDVMGEILTYEVDRIRTVLPKETDELTIKPGLDLCTLVTCTPYGINTHRLLVRGHRVENNRTGARVIAEAVEIDPMIVAPIVAFPFLFILFLMVMFKKPENTPKKVKEKARKELMG